MENYEENTTIRPLRNDHFDVDCSRARDFPATVKDIVLIAKKNFPELNLNFEENNSGPDEAKTLKLNFDTFTPPTDPL